MTFLKVEYDMCVYVDKYVDYVEKIKNTRKNRQKQLFVDNYVDCMLNCKFTDIVNYIM